MRRLFLSATAAVALLGAGALALAQVQPQHAPGHAMPMMPGGGHAGHGAAELPANASAVTRAFILANETMHRDMAIAFSGNADRDFVAGMIPHHQGAIDMARIVLEHGSDPEVRTIAEAVIREQGREIVQMRAILARLPAR